jgi:hypothetical protein
MVADIALFYARVASGSAASSRAAGAPIATGAATCVDVHSHDKVADLNGHVAAVTAVLTVVSARAGQAVATGKAISGVIISIPVVLAVKTLEARNAVWTCSTRRSCGAVNPGSDNVWHKCSPMMCAITKQGMPMRESQRDRTAA